MTYEQARSLKSGDRVKVHEDSSPYGMKAGTILTVDHVVIYKDKSANIIVRESQRMMSIYSLEIFERR